MTQSYGLYAIISNLIYVLAFYSRLPSSESHNLRAVFLLRIEDTKGRLGSQAFLAATMETGNKNRDDVHCTPVRTRHKHVIYFRQ